MIHWLFPVFSEHVKGSCAGHRFKVLERKQGGPYVPIVCWTCCKGWQWFPASATVWRTAGPWELILLGLAVPGDKNSSHPQSKGHLNRGTLSRSAVTLSGQYLGAEGSLLGCTTGQKAGRKGACGKASDGVREAHASSQRGDRIWAWG